MPAIDYNLIRPLRALLEERSVTRAAERLHMSQPSMSVALSRLRAHYDDPLLIRHGNSHELTPLAERLLASLPAALAEVEHVFKLQSKFSPVTSTRTFAIAGVDAAIARLGPGLTRIVAREAPNVRIEFPAADGVLVNNAPESLRTIDGAILPHGYVSGLQHLDLPPEQWVCLVDAASGLVEGATADEVLSRPWVQSLAAREGVTPAAWQLQLRGMEVKVVAATPHFFVLPALIIGTDRVALVPSDVARRLTQADNRLRAIAPPFDLEPIRDAFWWHGDHERDEGHLWLRDVLKRAVDSTIRKPNDGYGDIGIQ